MDKKPLAALILAKVSKGPKPDEEPTESADGLDSAISDMFDAQKSGDKDAYKEAFKAAVSMCSDDDYSKKAKEAKEAEEK
jgi:hypothetical protein